MPAVEARGWGWRYPSRRAWAVRGLDLRIESGERVLLLGASGAGKSTLLSGLAGVLGPRSGGNVEGELLVGGAAPDRSRGGTGLLFQDPEDQLVLGRAGDDVAFGLENRCVPRDAIWPRVEEALDAVAFPYGRSRPTSALSGGEKQRLALAGVLATNPDLLLLDEPTSNLDVAAADGFRARLAALLRRGTPTLVVVDHHVAEWADLVDRVVVLEPGGGVLADGPPSMVFGELRGQLVRAGVWVPDDVPRRTATTRPHQDRPHGPLIRAEGVSFRYPGSEAYALEGVAAEIRAAEILAITGENGAGKSTLALLLGGLLRPDQGHVTSTGALDSSAAGEDLYTWPASRLARHVGTVFQNPEHQFLCRRVDEELLIGARRVAGDARQAGERVSTLLERLRLGHLAAANPFTLSGGEQRRLSVAAALVTAPRVLVLDEPTFGQDRRTHAELVTLLGELRDEGSGVCVVSHDARLLDALADRTLRLPLPRAAGVAA